MYGEAWRTSGSATTKYIDPSKLAILVVGSGPQIKPPLFTLGKVTDIGIAIPPPPGRSANPDGH